MYSDPEVTTFIEEHFAPVRVHVKENHDAFQHLGTRFDAHWTPTILLIDKRGKEFHRIEGFLPRRDFMSQLKLGVARQAFDDQDYARAAPLFRQVVDEYRDTDAAAEALYWAGVAQYRATSDPSVLADTAREFEERYPESSWAKKSSVWRT